MMSSSNYKAFTEDSHDYSSRNELLREKSVMLGENITQVFVV